MSKRNGKEVKRLSSDKVFDVVNVAVMILLLFIFAWPLWFVIIASFSDPYAVWRGEILLIPKGINLDSYKEILKYKDIWIGYRNTIFYTILGTVINIVMTICTAYPLSRKDFRARNFIMALFMITMYFGGGLIPTYLIVRKLNMVNTVWSMMIPGAISVYNMIVMRSYFINSIPDTLQEAAELDGANPLQYLIRIVLPLSKPVIAVVGLYYAVGHWNDFFNALIYITDKNLLPLQSFLRNLLITNTAANIGDANSMNPEAVQRKMYLAQTIKYSAIVVSTIPVLCIYPFVQKHFVKGVMIGAVKG